ncbi:GNAT family N-acetyltransferase [Dictyobacter formicarum]|uniref:Acetyltransferase n=1 Tax=Dictyobacter formicarum TaxID=2778368 RepID=A0ABQ3VRK9_9CHLR|nr:GNAT family N-acetyltransferase [Dictyobacter formicarum]GHO88356.1 acetyltransferase [Dictyobacter formicarum]
MQITIHTHAQDFLAQTQDVLLQNEAANNLMLGISMRLQAQPDYYGSIPFLATVTDEHGLLVAACMTPPNRLILYSQRPEKHQAALDTLVEYLQNHQVVFPGCIGPVKVAEDFARSWQTATGQSYRIAVRERVFELTEVLQPPITTGRLRQATQGDRELLLKWMLAFAKEAHLDQPADDITRSLPIRLANGDFFFWETPASRIVSMAAKGRAMRTVINIGPVYTPPEARGKGYASSCVSALSQRLLDNGWRACSLFTDLSNPTSNSIYQKIGYRPLEDVYDIAFI